MNYMLLENQTLSSMKQEHFEYVKTNKPDPPPPTPKTDSRLCHKDMITCVIVIQQDEYQENRGGGSSSTQHKSIAGSDTSKKNIRYVTSSRDGTVKVWLGL